MHDQDHPGKGERSYDGDIERDRQSAHEIPSLAELRKPHPEDVARDLLRSFCAHEDGVSGRHGVTSKRHYQ
jgi:DNA topoisomerase VI subunit B